MDFKTRGHNRKLSKECQEGQEETLHQQQICVEVRITPHECKAPSPFAQIDSHKKKVFFFNRGQFDT